MDETVIFEDTHLLSTQKCVVIQGKLVDGLEYTADVFIRNAADITTIHEPAKATAADGSPEQLRNYISRKIASFLKEPAIQEKVFQLHYRNVAPRC